MIETNYGSIELLPQRCVQTLRVASISNRPQSAMKIGSCYMRIRYIEICIYVSYSFIFCLYSFFACTHFVHKHLPFIQIENSAGAEKHTKLNLIRHMQLLVDYTIH